MTKELETRMMLKGSIISVLITGMLITLNTFPVDVQKVFAEDDLGVESGIVTSNEVTIAATPGHSALASPIQTGDTTDLTIQAVSDTAPHNGTEIQVWDPGLSDEQPVVGIGCTNFNTNTAGPGHRWTLMADSFPPNGTFETVVKYRLPEAGDRILLPSFGSGLDVTPIATNADALGEDPDLVPPISSGADFAWVDDASGIANTDNTLTLGTYKFGSCGKEGVSGTQNFRGEVTFDVVASCTTLTKEANPKSGPFPLDVTYTYVETNCGEQGDSPLTSVSVTDIGEDADHDGSLDGSEDKNSNGILDPGCSPVVDVDVVAPFGFNDGDTDADGNLDPSETWTFECMTTLHSVGIFNNTAFSEGTICLDADCLDLDGIHTGDPACEEGTIGLLCDPAERNSTEVTVEKPIPHMTTQSQPSTTIAPGGAVTDKATVSGVGPTPTGTVSFFLCGPGLANPANGGGCPAGGTPKGAPVLLNGGGMATSIAVSGATTTPEGKYCWRAVYSGDENYTSASHTNSLISNNGGECFQVGGKGTIKIIKDTVPDGPQDFGFTHNIPSNPAVASPFLLDDDFSPPLSNTKTFLQVPAGAYTVTETTVPAVPLRSIRCVSDNDLSDTSIRIGNSASIDLDAGETVTCTFVNGIQPPPCQNGIVSQPQPEDSISMTTVKNKNLVKTIHAEKQIFDCELDDISVIADVTIVAEIYEDLNTKSVLSKQVEVVTCIKDPVAIKVMECALSIPTTDRIPVNTCTEQTDITHPQEMNTVNKGSTAKTIESQKEVFICTFNDRDSTNDKKVDLVTFTEIYQNLDTRISDTPKILSMKCVIKIDTVTVEACRFVNLPI